MDATHDQDHSVDIHMTFDLQRLAQPRVVESCPGSWMVYSLLTC